MTISNHDYQQVSELLGREPRGLREIPVRDQQGAPVVIRVASLVDNKPFPTLFWLVDKCLNYRLDQLEASGLIAKLQKRLDAEPNSQAQLAADHQDYIKQRLNYIDSDEARTIEKLGFTEVLQQRGIGGITNFGRIRCLHTYYAAHLVSSNLVGEWVDEYWQ